MYKNIIETYKKLYSLPELTHKESVDFDFFKLCRRNYKFVVICVYNSEKKFVLIRDINKTIGWELIGGYLEKNERIEDAINKIILKETGLSINELRPIALMKNIFEYNNDVIQHYGIAFIALAQGFIKSQPEHIKMMYVNDIPKRMPYQDKRILEIAKQKIQEEIYPSQEEIESSKKSFFPHFLNKYFVQKMTKNFASRKIRNKILQTIIDAPESIIDVSCGDDDFIFELEKTYHPDICIANDISWKMISLIKNKDKKGNIIFTNHNVLDLPFVKVFDLVIFKNTLHHIPTELQAKLIEKLSSLAKQLIIVDVEDPSQSNFLAKIWHWYYIHFLRDKGENFLTFKEFKELIKKNAGGKKVLFGTINTIKGKYFYTSIFQDIKGEEVEIKAKIDFSQVKIIENQLFSFGAILKKRMNETDVYFTAPYRDFIESKECLRIRERKDYLELTYKGPTTKEMNDKKQFWKQEINIPLNSSKKDAQILLESLGFKKIVEVVKEREKFMLGCQEIEIDNVKNAGWFIEIETIISNPKERQEALDKNVALLKQLGVDDKNIIEEPYRDIVLKATTV